MPSTDTGLRFPAEWEPQSGVMLSWPHQYSDWQTSLEEIEPVYIHLCKAISEHELCLILCYDNAHRDHVLQALRANDVALSNCHTIVCQTNDTWCRDYAPISTCMNSHTALNNFVFDGWGEKYEAGLDNAVSTQLHALGIFNNIKMLHHDVVLEGGSVESNGAGTLLTTSHCLLKRHPDKDKATIEHLLGVTLGVQRTLWLDHGQISGDDTDSHIDNLARFVNEQTIVYATCEDNTHPDYHALQSMQQQLQDFRQPDGAAYRLIPLPLPEPVKVAGEQLPASYVNFLIINDAVIVPLFNQPADTTAIAILQDCFPERHILGVDSRALIKQYGGIHCATMQFPKGFITPLN